MKTKEKLQELITRLKIRISEVTERIDSTSPEARSELKKLEKTRNGLVKEKDKLYKKLENANE